VNNCGNRILEYRYFLVLRAEIIRPHICVLSKL
jgi:hypothetical protein